MAAQSLPTAPEESDACDAPASRCHLFGKLRVDHPGGTHSERPVMTEWIAPNRLALIYPGYVHIGSACRFQTRAEERSVVVTGVTCDCEHVERERHRVLIALDGEIDPETLRPAGGSLERVEKAALRGETLVLDSEEASWRLLQMHLVEAGLSVRVCSTLGAALDEVRRRPIDLSVIASAGWEHSPEETIRSLRETGWRGAAIALRPDPRGGLVESAGRIDVALPIMRDTIVDAARRLLSREEGAESIVSEMAGDPAMAPSVAWFCDHVRDRAHRLARLTSEGDLPEAIQICQILRDTAEGFGFPGLRRLAESARADLMMCGSPLDCCDELREIEAYAMRMRA